MKPTLISLFSGIGGLDLAAHWAGFETVRFVEKEPFCQKVLAKHWPNVPIDDDVFTSHPEHADVVCGGFPCQPFSEAGLQKGEEDERYLLPEMLRIIREVQPYAVLFENVRGFPKLDHGNSFKYLLRKLAEMGFDAQWGHIFAKDVGAPHPRERWFCVAYMVNSSTSISCDEREGNERKSKQAVNLAANKRIIGESLHSQELEYSESDRLQTCFIQPIGGEPGFSSERFNETGRVKRGLSQSRLFRTTNGLPSRMDFVGFPAYPGEPQYDYEPPRTAPRTEETSDRVKALGNAVVPQVAYPIFAAIKEWLDNENN